MNNRLERINAEMMRAISQIISSELKNPAIEGIISVTKVEATSDLKHAKVFISIYNQDEEKKQAAFKAVESSKNFIRHQLKSAIDLRTIPELHIQLDQSLDNSYRINELLNQIKKEQ